ncbi:hypothetical protein CKAH01_05805 [Colletotrichum kahawae]|uniref:Uncharacterized protein n=1 Tax=Colletotrichum kahawae TaxID=34407 RepID=A0AAD9YDF2_COLKA|nr:hypothetical protein CKAH01_05805 [Colletotrichum kahawae]
MPPYGYHLRRPGSKGIVTNLAPFSAAQMSCNGQSFSHLRGPPAWMTSLSIRQSLTTAMRLAPDRFRLAPTLPRSHAPSVNCAKFQRLLARLLAPLHLPTTETTSLRVGQCPPVPGLHTAESGCSASPARQHA